MKRSARSRDGCLTCKLRKKRCDEGKPACGDCLRLGRRCEYITNSMSKVQIKQLKDEMERIEAESKLRKRKSILNSKAKAKIKAFSYINNGNSTNNENKVIFNPLMVPQQQQQQQQQHHHQVQQVQQFKKIDEIYDILQTNPRSQTQSPNFIPLSPNFIFSTTDNNINQYQNQNQNQNLLLPHLSLNGEDDSFIDLFSPHLLQNHFKFESPTPTPTPPVVQYENTNQRQIHAIPEINTNTNANLMITNTTKNKFQRPNNEKEPIMEIYMNPSYVKTSTLNYLTPIGKRLYEYYRDHLSFIVNSAKKDDNMYLNTFLPMAHVDLGVLYGILAWSSFHLGGDKLERQGKYYINQAHREFIRSPLLIGDETSDGLGFDDCHSQFGNSRINNNDKDCYKIKGDADEEEEEIEMEMKLDLMKKDNLSKDNMINMRLAAFEILCGVEICKGDVSNWSKYLKFGSKLIKMKGGLESFNNSKDEHFLATNYAYHDITSVSVNNGNLHFDLIDYEKMWSKSNELGFTDPLHNLSSPIFKIIAEINKLVNGSRELTSNLSPKSDTNSPLLGISLEDLNKLQNENLLDIQEIGEKKHSTTNDLDGEEEHEEQDINLDDLNQLIIEYQRIDQMLNNAKPKIFETTYSKDLELQLTIFECFQITAKIHLRQSVMRMNSSCIEIQYLINQLVNLLDVILGSDFESCLCFPMFIAGLNCVRQRDRNDMLKRFKEFIDRYKWKNVVRCEVVIKKVWESNEKGLKFID